MTPAEKIMAGLYLLATFLISFFLATVALDAVCRRNGYYQAGIEESAEVGK